MRIASLGTLDIALVAEVERLPRPGETVPSRVLRREPGGAGIRQAIAAARLDADVTVYGRVGADPFGDEVLALLREAGVHTGTIEKVPDVPTGASLVLVSSTRHHLAAHVPGANGKLDEAYIARHVPQIHEANAALLDLAIPASALRAVLKDLPALCPVVASHPVSLAPGFLWERVDFLVGAPDAFLSQAGPTAGGGGDVARACQAFLDRGVRNAVVVAGKEGAYLAEQGGVTRFPAHDLPFVNPGLAVDAFSAALAVRLAAGSGPYEAMGFASAAASLSASRMEGLGSLPTSAEVLLLLSRFTPHPSRPTG